MPGTHSAPAKPDPYASLKEAINDEIEKRPNYRPTMEFHQDMADRLESTPHILMNIAPWHWTEVFSTHVVLTPNLLPSGRPVYVAVTRNAHSSDIVMMADSCVPQHDALPTPPQGLQYQTSHRGTATICTIIQEPADIPSAVDQLASAAVAAATP